jgi:dolichol kinase
MDTFNQVPGLQGKAGEGKAGNAAMTEKGEIKESSEEPAGHPGGFWSWLRSFMDDLPFWAREVVRKSLHIGVVALAVPLHWWGWWYGIIFAVVAGIWNGFGMPRFFRFTFREDEEKAGYSRGMLSYPAIVLALMVLFPLPIAASQWATLSFGDGFATLIGRFFGKRHLFWNREKTLAGISAFFVMGTIGATFFFWLVLPNADASSPLWQGTQVVAAMEALSFLKIIAICAASTVAAAFFETVPFTHIDDNVAAPLAGALVKLGLCFLL